MEIVNHVLDFGEIITRTKYFPILLDLNILIKFYTPVL